MSDTDESDNESHEKTRTRNEFVVQYIVPNEESFLKFQGMSDELEDAKVKFERDKFKWETKKEMEWSKKKTLELISDNELFSAFKRENDEKQEKWLYVYKITMFVCTFVLCFSNGLVLAGLDSSHPGSGYKEKTHDEQDTLFWKSVAFTTVCGLMIYGTVFPLIYSILFGSLLHPDN
jgi:hypothetical protein